MTAKLELVSFHFGLLFASFLLFIIATRSFYPAVLSSIITVIAVSWSFRAFTVSSWEKAAPHFASVLISIGHLAPLYTVCAIYSMHRAGAGSGLIFIPMLIWAAIFYPWGILCCMLRLLQKGDLGE